MGDGATEKRNRGSSGPGWSLRWWRLAPIVALSIAVAACGSRHLTAQAADGGLKPHCDGGSAALGTGTGVITFRVDCRRGKGRFFRFVISRGDTEGRHVTISGFEVRPRIAGPGMVSRRGYCQRRRQSVACRGRANGRVTLRGSIRVPRVNLCRSRIRLTQVVPRARKEGEVRTGPLKVDVIYSGIPRGC